MRKVAEIQAPQAATPASEGFPQTTEFSPELVAYHIQLGRQLRSEAFAQMIRSIGGAVVRLLDRSGRDHAAPNATVSR